MSTIKFYLQFILEGIQGKDQDDGENGGDQGDHLGGGVGIDLDGFGDQGDGRVVLVQTAGDIQGQVLEQVAYPRASTTCNTV